MHWYLLPFSLLYGLVVNIRNRCFDWGVLKSKSYNVPVISIGNISVGGTGKTPHTEYLINHLKDNFKLASISRGYKRKSKGFVEVKTDSQANFVGDEALQIKQKYPQIRVIVDEKRVHAIDTLLQDENTPDIFLLDDAFQHRHVTPGLNILLMDYHRLITKDHLLPVGRLREPAHNCYRANVVIVTKCPQHLTPIEFRIMQKELNLFPFQDLFFTTFSYKHIVPVFTGIKSSLSELSDLKGLHVLALSGIANPALLYKKIKESGAIVEKFAFSDHHSFTIGDVDKVIKQFQHIKSDKKVIVCTEKDAVKLRTTEFKKKFGTIPVYFLPIEVQFMNEGEKQFMATVKKFINRFYEN